MEYSSKFHKFDIHTTPYKTVNSQPVDLYVLLPKNLPAGPHPVLIHFHGGFLTTGHAIFPDWAAQWALDYQLAYSAIRISANYRLLPESNGADIHSDVSDLLSWVEKDLAPYLKSVGSSAIPDVSKVLVYGESAGGYLAIQSSLMRPDLIQAAIAAYPMTYLDSDWYSTASTTKSIFGSPQLPKALVEEHLASLPKGRVLTGAFPPARSDIMISILQSGLLPKVMGTDDSFFPARTLEKMSGKEKVPFLFVLQGKQDSAVPCKDSEKFVKLWESKFGKAKVRGAFEDGEHGFDADVLVETPWMKEGLVEVTKAWLG